MQATTGTQPPLRDPTSCVWRRVVAAALDSAVVLFVATLGFAASGALRFWDGGFSFSLGWAGLLATWLLAVAYWTAFEASPLAATPGKLLFGVRVVHRDGRSRVGLGAALARNLARLVDQFLCFAVGPMFMATTTGHRRLGDMLGRTLVVHRRAAGNVASTPWEG